MAKERGVGAPAAARRSGSELEILGGPDPMRGYLALPPSGRGPGILVIQEWWGLVDHIRDVADRLAREGFVALAPDLYHGERTDAPDVASRLMMDLQVPRAARDLEAAVDFLIRQDPVTGARVGAIGFCMGGQLALFAAARSPRIRAVVDCYGIHPNVPFDPAGLEAAVLGIFAERDEWVPPQAARRLEAELREAGKRVTIRIFPGVGHAFMNDSRPDAYDAVAAARAFADAIAFLRAELS